VLDVKPGGTAAARHVLAPASSPSTGGVPSSRWGASRWVASALVLWTASLAKNRPTGEGLTARRVARARRHGYVVRPVARRAWVHALGELDPGLPPAQTCRKITPRLEGRLPGVPELRTTRRRRPARRAFPRRGRGRGTLGCGRPGHTRLTMIRKEKPRLDGRYSRAQGSARRHLAAQRRVEGFPLGPANWGAA
jgi:hypothetical protein